MCTHINVGVVDIKENRIIVNENLKQVFGRMLSLKKINEDLKVLIWIGGPSKSINFFKMIEKRKYRRAFIESIKSALKAYQLDGVDIDYEFPSTYDGSRNHFSELLHEIRQEYDHDHQKYLLSVAVAAPEGIAYFAYDIPTLNKFCDYINVMSYDYHFYSKATPFTGNFLIIPP